MTDARLALPVGIGWVVVMLLIGTPHPVAWGYGPWTGLWHCSFGAFDC